MLQLLGLKLLPKALLAVLTSTRLKKVGHGIHADINVLRDDFPTALLAINKSIIDLRKIALRRGILSEDGPSGRDTIIARSLAQRLPSEHSPLVPKGKSSTATDTQKLSLEAWAYHEAFNTLQAMPTVGRPVQDTAPIATAVSFTWSDSILAHGVLLAKPEIYDVRDSSGAVTRRVQLQKSQALVQITRVFCKSAKVPFHNCQLQSFGSTPFNIVVNYSRLRTRLAEAPNGLESPVPETNIGGSGPEQELYVPNTDDGCDTSRATDRDRTDSDSDSDSDSDLDSDSDSDSDSESDSDSDDSDINYSDSDSSNAGFPTTIGSMPTPAPTIQKPQPSQIKLRHLPPCEQPGTAEIPSRTLEDAWHVMDRILKTIPKKHSLRKPFATAFSDTLFTLDEDDRKAVEAALQARKVPMTLAQMRRRNSSWLWQRIRRYIPDKEYLYAVLVELFEAWGNLLCSKLDSPLFNKTTWRKVNGVLESVANGWVSDPPGISLYVRLRVDKPGLSVYRCIRGTNSVEGGVHMVLMRIFGSLNASVELADCVLADFRYRHNIDVSAPLLLQPVRN